MKMRVGAVMEQHLRNIYHLVQNTVQGNNIQLFILITSQETSMKHSKTHQQS